MALTRGQEDLITWVKTWLKGKDSESRPRKEPGTTAAKLMAAFKAADRTGKGYLAGDDFARCTASVGLPHPPQPARGSV